MVEAGISTFMYLDNRLIYGPIKEDVSTSVLVALSVLADMGFKVNLDKCALTPTRKLCWLWTKWDVINASLSLTSQAGGIKHVRAGWQREDPYTSTFTS